MCIRDRISIVPLIDAGIASPVEHGAEILRFEWAAMKISDGDELYHTRWANVEGAVTIVAPCAGASVVAINSEVLEAHERGARLETIIDANTWLVELALPPSVQLAKLGLVDEHEYARSCGVGMFHDDPDAALSYTSYG